MPYFDLYLLSKSDGLGTLGGGFFLVLGLCEKAARREVCVCSLSVGRIPITWGLGLFGLHSVSLEEDMRP